jgi:hypothetical protein
VRSSGSPNISTRSNSRNSNLSAGTNSPLHWYQQPIALNSTLVPTAPVIYSPSPPAPADYNLLPPAPAVYNPLPPAPAPAMPLAPAVYNPLPPAPTPAILNALSSLQKMAECEAPEEEGEDQCEGVLGMLC